MTKQPGSVKRLATFVTRPGALLVIVIAIAVTAHFGQTLAEREAAREAQLEQDVDRAFEQAIQAIEADTPASAPRD